MTTGLLKEQNLEKHIQKQMGCMAGFLHIFDRHQFLTGKRFYSAKRLPPPPVLDSTSESEKSAPSSPANSTESENPTSNPPPPPPLSKPPLPLPIFESKGEGNRSLWRFRKEAPRLSLDSRATTDAKGSLHPKEIRTDNSASDTADGGPHHRSPSVIARLMGLEPLPSSSGGFAQPEKHPELRRSASESRVSKDLFQSRFIPNGAVFNSKQQPTQAHVTPVDVQYPDPRNYSNKNAPKGEGDERLDRGGVNSTPPWRAPPHRKSFFDSGDIFPEPKQNVTIHGEIEKRIRMRGINEPSQDLETLKQILEALQLKGLLHSKPPPSQQNQIRHRNFVYDESPIVVMKPSRSTPINRRMGNDYSPANGRNQARGGRRNETLISPQHERNARSPTRTGRSPSPTARSNSLVRPKPLINVHTQRRTNESPENHRKASPVYSPKVNNTRRTGTDPTVSNRLPRSKKPTSDIHQKENVSNVVVLEDESSSNSGSSITTPTDTERSKVTEEYRDGRRLLERCDKLLHSIAEMSATEAQPSPVSVLDSSFYKDESLTPSPVTTKRNIDFKDHQSGELEEEICSPPISPIRSKHIETSDDSDFVYISDILRAIHYLPENSDVFQLLEKQHYLKGIDTTKAARLDRKLIFDTIDEILDRNNRLPPWNITTLSLDKVWMEFERIRERDSVDDLFESICSVLKKDLAGDAATGWGNCPVEMSEAVLDIERLIFKDLICDSIGDLAELTSRDTLSSVVPRRKLVF
ncbi:protein longifolia 1 [Phtheirospermum japonicum]|uniref:Protein longifolia 1 n=1 Tax=Phtheirospermum japonicum TaxID=374723 RepID=A0A830B2U4_9LAMI|nr:protein longifolia 1 [Phtheirospermum japonicum]